MTGRLTVVWIISKTAGTTGISGISFVNTGRFNHFFRILMAQRSYKIISVGIAAVLTAVISVATFCTCWFCYGCLIIMFKRFCPCIIIGIATVFTLMSCIALHLTGCRYNDILISVICTWFITFTFCISTECTCIKCITFSWTIWFDYFTFTILMGIRIYIQFCFKFFLADTADLNIISFFNTGCIFVFFRCQLMSGCRKYLCKALITMVADKRSLSCLCTCCRSKRRALRWHMDRIRHDIIRTVIQEILCLRGIPCIIAGIVGNFSWPVKIHFQHRIEISKIS